jgi:hypothetical protein
VLEPDDPDESPDEPADPDEPPDVPAAALAFVADAAVLDEFPVDATSVPEPY